MILRIFGGVAALLTLTVVVLAQAPPSPPPTEITLQPVPAILRLHVPRLTGDRGVLVQSVMPESASAKAGIRVGDVLLEVGGRTIHQDDTLGKLESAFPIVVLRRGRIRVLRAEPREMPADWVDPLAPFPPNPHAASGLWMPGFSSSSASSRGGAGNRAVAISRAGDQISLEMSLPQWVADPIRLRGTAAEIERQIQESKLPEAAKREVRATLLQAN
ncbi:PDZ domain-containing protein [Stieleria sp. TO1_6]|uniref:PDZ domain-containing protein n=1 Tax=Stieleria tagensis TaxID=2956795 RepID=UPI00209ACFE8|nr:PDZ domain-containing protein [Stieleria tagensis]MCO8125506.1 PDZ domain-containing protein [Stieleria tagensis]